MSCNCATTEELEKLYKLYGAKTKEYKNKTTWWWAKYYVQKVAIILIMLLIIPMLFLYVAYVTIFSDGKISLKEFFNLDKNRLNNVREQ